MDTDLKIIGYIKSEFTKREDTPKQGDEGGVEAVLHIKEEFSEAMDGLKPGMEILLLSWLHEGDRSYLRVHPRGNKATPMRGVFSTRSPDRPNPIGLHPVTIKSVNGLEIRVYPLEAIDGTPLLDIKNA
ncbi:tRNA-Thr(GGU) m(6)t(6)A37 methyltransferase TsaA [Maridesulfovibrio ferrireducens]|uniref:tRNA-Thr(GGU) m(6)t(6)A37 methyltransferase TsaA n=1 Tax=Maridesulfovibrio ferrireducens TaxID=246191 RepID=A0A1G9HK93_9BACT|nr:tRNA (N6-threonylcarbamoyladenosine(37)-N6)-methyltransferase TrmO [Maridesulfovibrio ferrireducens]SDL13305.1 tRNA-Thr(GGU) m(6)t(6)A37 methyltransferase TsaA [Maridesulfovibrio ferrireducens]